MFGIKVLNERNKRIAELEQDVRDGEYYYKNARELNRGLLKKNAELRALNEKLYTAIDKKNEKIRALRYALDNPGAGLDIPVPGPYSEWRKK